jgi:hypothetical protein
MHAWSSLKSDLWFHLKLENALVFWWSGHQSSSGLDFVEELSREQREIRELVRQNGFVGVIVSIARSRISGFLAP